MTYADVRLLEIEVKLLAMMIQSTSDIIASSMPITGGHHDYVIVAGPMPSDVAILILAQLLLGGAFSARGRLHYCMTIAGNVASRSYYHRVVMAATGSIMLGSSAR